MEITSLPCLTPKSVPYTNTHNRYIYRPPRTYIKQWYGGNLSDEPEGLRETEFHFFFLLRFRISASWISSIFVEVISRFGGEVSGGEEFSWKVSLVWGTPVVEEEIRELPARTTPLSRLSALPPPRLPPSRIVLLILLQSRWGPEPLDSIVVFLTTSISAWWIDELFFFLWIGAEFEIRDDLVDRFMTVPFVYRLCWPGPIEVWTWKIILRFFSCFASCWPMPRQPLLRWANTIISFSLR